MSRSIASFIALILLLGLTFATWKLAEDSASAGTIAAIAALKVAIIAGVFLELDRAWPGWAALATVVTVGIAGGAVLLM